MRGSSYGEIACAVQAERDAAWWWAVRGFGVAERRRESADLVHARRGAQTAVDDWLVKICGMGWREEIYDLKAQFGLKEGSRRFVRRAYEALNLPAPPDFYAKGSAGKLDATPDHADVVCPSLSDLPLPPALGRDVLLHDSGQRW